MTGPSLPPTGLPAAATAVIGPAPADVDVARPVGLPAAADPHMRVAAGLTMFIPGGRARDPITGTNWEGVGVKPDIAVPSDTALKAALERLGVSSVSGEIDTVSRSRVFEPDAARK